MLRSSTNIKRLRARLSAIIASAGTGSTSGKTDTLAQALALVSRSSVVVTPIVTDIGGKLLLVTASQDQADPVVTSIDLPELTTDRVRGLLEGPGGWLAAFARDLPWQERKIRASRAVEEIGSELWSLLAEPMDRALGNLGVASGSRLIFLPSGGLGLLPLGLAREASSGLTFARKI